MNRFLTITTLSGLIMVASLGFGSSAFGALLYDINDIDTVLIYDPLDASPGAELDGTKPEDRTGGIGSNAWDAGTGSFTTAGVINSGEGSESAWQSFTPTQGNIYMVSATLNTFGNDNNVKAWNSLGYSSATAGNTGTSANHGYGWMLLREERDPFDPDDGGPKPTQDAATYFAGYQTGGGGNFDPAEGALDYAIVLDATDADSANWTMEFFLDGTSVGGPLTADSDNYANIQSVGFSTLNPAAGTIQDFQLATLTIIPEPATLALLGLGGAVMLAGRRRRA